MTPQNLPTRTTIGYVNVPIDVKIQQFKFGNGSFAQRSLLVGGHQFGHIWLGIYSKAEKYDLYFYFLVQSKFKKKTPNHTCYFYCISVYFFVVVSGDFR